MTTAQPYKNGHTKIDYGDRLPPQDKEAERALIGALLIDPDRIHEVSTIIAKEDFYLAANGLVFDAIQRVTRKGDYPDIINVMSELRALGHADVGDGQDRAESYLMNIVASTGWAFSADSYARTIAEMATRRRLIAVSSQVSSMAWDEQMGLAGVLESSRQALFAVSERNSGRGLSHVSTAVTEYMEFVEARASSTELPGLVSGFHDLDKILNGLQKKKLIIIAGRPGMGKTALQVAMIDEMTVERGKRGAIFSLEM
jgi:replicative DNA helicase